MAKKTMVEIEAVNAIDYDGEKVAPGKTFKCEKKEAERLLALGAARVPVPEEPKEKADRAEPLTVETLRAEHGDLVKQIEEQAREGYVSQKQASKDFDALHKELDEARAALEKVAGAAGPEPKK